MTAVLASSVFRVTHIKIIGAQRVPASTVLSYLPIKPGQRFVPSKAASMLQTLYNTGYFSNIKLERSGNNLIVRVTERPTIGLVKVVGNHSLPKKQLDKALSSAGLVSGQVLDASKLKSIVEGLRQEYFNQGHYNAKVAPRVIPKTRNRVAIMVQVDEGPIAKIEGIKVIGSHAFTERVLLREFKLSTPSILSSLNHSDEYSKPKLDADIDTLTSYYMDRGYLRFTIASQQVSIAADGAGIYIVIGVNEGPLYHFTGADVLGNPLHKKAILESKLTIKAGDLFSRSTVLLSSDNIQRYLGDMGYAFPMVNPQPDINDTKHTVFVHYQVKPGKKVYIRRIEFVGNSATQEQVYRKRLLQFEGSRYSLSNLNESKRRIANLAYVANVQAKISPVIGTNNQADMQYLITPRNAGKATVQVGFSDTQGFLYGANLSEPNFLGTGNSISLAFSRSAYANSYSFGYSNPYATTWGASRNFNIFYTKTKPSSSLSYSSYDLDSYGLSVGSGIPVSGLSMVNGNLSYEHNKLDLSSSASDTFKNFSSKYGNRFNQFGINLGWTRTNYDTYPFPTSGTYNDVDGTLWFPADKHSLTYYTLNYTGQAYVPIHKGFIGQLKAVLGYGNGIGKTHELPFYRNFYAGGITTVPGFSPSSLGPQDQYGNALGGNILLVGQTSLIFPNGISKSLRTAFTLAAGNVYSENDSFKIKDIKYSAGVSLTWLTPFLGPIQIGLAVPFNVGSSKDNVSVFGFNMGASI